LLIVILLRIQLRHVVDGRGRARASLLFGIELQGYGSLQLEELVRDEVEVLQLRIGNRLLVLNYQLDDGEMMLLSAFDEHRYLLQNAVSLLPQYLSLDLRDLVLSHQLDEARQLHNKYFDHLVRVELSLFPVDLLLLQVKEAALLA